MWLKFFKMANMATKKTKNGILTRQTFGATDLKLCMHAQLDSKSNMGWVPPGHTSFSYCVRLNVNNGTLENTWT